MTSARSHILHALLLFAAVLSAWPLVQVGLDWYEVASYQQDANTPMDSGARASDWIVWEDDDGAITAEYVFPAGPGYEAGIRDGDVLFLWDNQQYFYAEDLKNSIAFLGPGTTRTYLLTRGNEFVEASVELARHPTFLYPRSGTLWQFSLWGFTLGSFLHLLGLFIAGPLARHNRAARLELALIAVSSLWIFGNLARMLLVELLGPPHAGTAYDTLFQVLTTVGLTGWIGFPLFLVLKVTTDTGVLSRSGRWMRPLLLLVPFVLVLVVLVTLARGALGPVSVEDLLVPILFYASCYIGVSAAAALLADPARHNPEHIEGWGRAGSSVIVFVSVVVALAVLGVIPLLTALTEQVTGWIIVSAQLLAVVPVTIYTIGTLRYGKVDDILSRTFVYTLALGLIFFTFVGGVTALDTWLDREGNSRIVIEGLLVVILLIAFERLGRGLRVQVTRIFSAERSRARKAVSRFIEGITDYLDAETLATEAVRVAASAFGARSAVLFLKSPSEPETWVMGNFNPTAPYVTEQVFLSLWPHFRANPAIWARNPELSTHTLPARAHRTLMEYGAALAIPVRGDGRPVGMFILATKTARRAVYNLEDLEQLRSFAVHVGLAAERLQMVEREKRLASESSEAHLVALRAQINPHFLFNALNTILSLIEEQPSTAEEVVENLAAIFRYTLQTGSKPFVPLSDEIQLVHRYLNIEQARFGDRLEVDVSIESSACAHPVPAFAVQTMVENAIKHGIEKVRGAGRLTISARVAEPTDADMSMVVVEVRDSGAGIPALFPETGFSSGRQPFFGIGLSNVFERMTQLYGRDDLLQLASTAGEGTTARLCIPNSTPSHDPNRNH